MAYYTRTEHRASDNTDIQNLCDLQNSIKNDLLAGYDYDVDNDLKCIKSSMEEGWREFYLIYTAALNGTVFHAVAKVDKVERGFDLVKRYRDDLARQLM